MLSVNYRLVSLFILLTLSLASPATAISQVIVFEDSNMQGTHKHFFSEDPNLKNSDDGFWNDRISSIVVISGTWAFYDDSIVDSIERPRHVELTPGVYPNLKDKGIPNDGISAILFVSPFPD